MLLNKLTKQTAGLALAVEKKAIAESKKVEAAFDKKQAALNKKMEAIKKRIRKLNKQLDTLDNADSKDFEKYINEQAAIDKKADKEIKSLLKAKKIEFSYDYKIKSIANGHSMDIGMDNLRYWESDSAAKGASGKHNRNPKKGGCLKLRPRNRMMKSGGGR